MKGKHKRPRLSFRRFRLRGKAYTVSASFIAVLGLVFMSLGFVSAPVQATSGTKTIEAKALTSHGCDSSEWHFVITQVESAASAPGSITVNWANGGSQAVPLDKVTGGTAHYATTSNLDSTVTSATTSIYQDWSGQFNLSHGPCGTPPEEPEGSNNSSSAACEKITVGAPTGVKPDGATVVIKLDGVVTQPGTYDATPGTHVVTTYVNGVEVDKDTVTVEKCAGEQPMDKVTYTEWVDGDKSCESKTVTQTRTKTVTPYTWNGSEWVLDTANATSTTETQTRPMSPEELEKCEGTPPGDSCPGLTGSIKTTLADGSVVNGNIYLNKTDVYIYGIQLTDVTKVYVKVTDPSGSTVLSSIKEVAVTNGLFGPVQLPTFGDSPNNGDEYKVWVSSSPDFEQKCTKFDNFKVKGDEPPPASVTPAKPSATQPNCDQPNMTVTPGSQPGVIWSPSGATVLQPGESVTYTAMPAEDYEFPDDAQTSWTFTNTFDVSKCEEEPTPVVPTEPTQLDLCEPSQGPTEDSYTIPNDPNFTYTVDGVETDPGTYPAELDEYEIVAVPNEGVTVKEGAKTEWTFVFSRTKCHTPPNANPTGGFTVTCEGVVTGKVKTNVAADLVLYTFYKDGAVAAEVISVKPGKAKTFTRQGQPGDRFVLKYDGKVLDRVTVPAECEDEGNPPPDHPVTPPHAGATSGTPGLGSYLLRGGGAVFLLAALVMLFGARRPQVGEV